MIRVEQYSPRHAALWNQLLHRALNPLFLFHRDFMDYHSDRFTDHSLLVYRDGKPIAIFPANEKPGIIYSHQGLTFGGLLTVEKLSVGESAEVFYAVLKYYHEAAFDRLVYKQIPPFLRFYNDFGENYLLHALQAERTACDLNSVLDFGQPFHMQERRRRGARKAERLGVKVARSEDFEGFWEMLATNLDEKFGVRPVHSLQEITKLVCHFPENIVLYTAVRQERLLAGTVLFSYPGGVHAQYIASTDAGRQCGAVDLLFHRLIGEYSPQRRFFSFGVSNTRQGNAVNRGLLEWKEGWGTHPQVHNIYGIDTGRYGLLREFF